MKIGEYIKQYRDATGISQRELAKRCNVSNSFISMLEKDRNPHTNKPIDLSIDKYQAIAAGTGITLKHLFVILGDDAPKNYKPLLPKNMQSKTENNNGEEQAEIPRTPEAQLISVAIDKLPEEQRKLAVKVLQTVFTQYSGYFNEKGSDENDS